MGNWDLQISSSGLLILLKQISFGFLSLSSGVQIMTDNECTEVN